jgi:hypothetical protein
MHTTALSHISQAHFHISSWHIDAERDGTMSFFHFKRSQAFDSEKAQ